MVKYHLHIHQYMSHYKKAQMLVLHGWNIAEAILYICVFIYRYNEV
jgi:hypothetical protein